MNDMCKSSGAALILSDDLTGANDTSAQFAKKGFPTAVVLQEERLPDFADAYRVHVLNMETRGLPADEAYAAAAKLLQALPLDRYSLVYKKIDSTLRGNIGAEIDAFMASGAFDFAVMAPAYPSNCRITVGGYHLVQQTLLEDSPSAQDRKNPVRESYVPDLVRLQSRMNVRHVGAKELRSAASLDLRATKEDIWVFDAVNDADLERIVGKVQAFGLRPLWIGSAGLAEALAGAMAPAGTGGASAGADPGPETGAGTSVGPVLIVAGSVHAATRAQIERTKREGAAYCGLDPIALLRDEAEAQALALAEADAPLRAGRDLIVTTDASAERMAAVRAYAAERRFGPNEAEDRIASALGRIGAELIRRHPLDGAVLTGGDTAYRTMGALNVGALVVRGEIEPGIAWCEDAAGGLAPRFATKSGGFGGEDALSRCLRHLKRDRVI